MNKKVLTLCAGFLLAGSLTAVAQYCPTNGEVLYRTHMVNAAALDKGFQDVKEINENLWYQLRVDQKDASEGQTGDVKVLTVERDYSTGKLYLTTRKIEDAALTHSLWKIKKNPVEVNGRRFCFVNKETDFALTFDHFNALQVAEDGTIKDANTVNADWDFLNDGLMDGCNKWWDLYTTDESKNPFDYSRVYSYFHNGDSIMYLAQASKLNLPSAIAPTADEKKRAGVETSFQNSDVIVAVKDSKANAGDYAKNVQNALKITPVVAGAKVLNAAEINSMIDADGSWLSFDGHIKAYAEWADAKNENEANKKIARFFIKKPGSDETLEVANNPLSGEFVAEASQYVHLARTNYGDGSSEYISASENNKYAGYDILLKKKEAREDLGKDYFEYLMVSEKMYDNIETGNYTGLEVKTDLYAHIDYGKGSIGSDTDLTDNKRAYTKDASSYNSELEYPDPLEARYHWKVTYYPSNDSLVFEPLNASRMAETEYNDNLPFEKTHLANAAGKEYYNTINAGLAYDDNYDMTNHATDNATKYNAMYNKYAGVPVALYAMNFGPEDADSKAYLTVSAAGGKVEAGKAEYAAVCKFGDTQYITSSTGSRRANNPAYVTNAKSEDVENGVDYQAQMRLRLEFDNFYTPLLRATQEPGVYHITLSTVHKNNTQTEQRIDGAYLVADMAGHLVYDVQETNQDFDHMPATQWVVENLGCLEKGGVNENETPVVRIVNREYRDVAFEGQLYADGKGGYYILNHRDYAKRPTQEEVSNHHLYTTFNCADTIKFDKIENVNTLGYLNLDRDTLSENVYQFQHLVNGNGNLMLGTDETNNLKMLNGETVEGFELFIVEAPSFTPQLEEQFNSATGTNELVWKGKWKAQIADSVNYGYASEQAQATQLRKTFYKIKVKDANLIDNDHRFVAIDGQHKYVIREESEITKENGLTFAIFQLKENNCLNGEHYYALVNTPYYTAIESGDKETENLYKGIDKDGSSIFFVSSRDNIEVRDQGIAIYDADKDKVVYRAINNSQITGKLGVEASTLDTKLDDLCGTSSDVFAVLPNTRSVYRTLPSDLVNQDDKVIDIRTASGDESLFEDSHSVKGLNYLAVENKSVLAQNPGIYVDYVQASNARMPQYLFAVAADSVPAYTYCDENGRHGINPTCDHAIAYPGYVEGRFLVNYTDSINNAMIDKQTNADKFKHENYTRLGFVEAVHRGDSLYVLKAPYTLASLKLEDPNGDLYICPDSLAKEKEGIIYDIVKLDGTHNNAAFSLRNTGDADDTFMIESNDVAGNSAIGSFEGAWVKIQNGVPVLAQFYNVNGDHNTGDTMNGNASPATSMEEVINQAALFTFTTLDKDASATANEEIAAGTVTVVATDGAVIVKGAEGKNVIVSTILGKVVANETINSDNETIAAPAGIVVVSVDGESFKVVVK